MTAARGQRVPALCVCCGGRILLLVVGPTVWKAEVICHRCNVGKCGKPEREPGTDIDAFLREHGCKSRLADVDGRRVSMPILRHRGVR